ncbi:MAG TPA: RES domain-containing protein, partial [Longimicrobium sp.]|nr:RES domain-containing protein [Longimicrobium sp.]
MRPEPADAAAEPGPPPLPPRDLKKRALPIHVVPAVTKLYRIHPVDRAPLFFGPAPGQPPRGRWDAPDGKFGVCYMAEQSYAAFAECFLRQAGVMALEMADLRQRGLALFHPVRDLRLVAMHGAG